MTSTEAPICAYNRFPVAVTGPDTWHAQARVVVTCPDGDQPARLMVWVTRSAPILDAPIDLDASDIARPPATWRVVTDAGDYLVEPGRGCGCGHPLKRHQPFEPMRMGRLPR